ncbi:MAG: helix-turn-helix domain-containing protein [Chloroflexota bacterium]|nr:helix-turn-helix domain-containing protein [Chloroflexota bacterium]
MTGEPEYLPALEAARLLGMSDAALRRRIRRGLLPVYRDPADRRFRLLKVSDLEDLVSSRRVVPGADMEGV